MPVFLEKIGLPTMENGLKLEANPGLTDLDVEILRQANMQGGRAHGFMRLLLDRVPEEEPVDLVARNLRSGRRSLLTDMVPQFDWAALSYVPNPPLHYERDGFDQRCAALQARAEALHEAILTQDVQA